MKIPYQETPCKDCPFRKSGGACHLGEKRAKEILEGNEKVGFVCHKTTNGKKGDRLQCAGAMILARKEKKNQPFLNTYEKLIGRMYLRKAEEIVDSYDEFINKQSQV